MLSRAFCMTALVLEGRQLASHKDVRLAEGDKPIGTTHELQAQSASAPILGHQTLTTSLRGRYYYHLNTEAQRSKGIWPHLGEQDLNPGLPDADGCAQGSYLVMPSHSHSHTAGLGGRGTAVIWRCKLPRFRMSAGGGREILSTGCTCPLQEGGSLS